MLRIFNRHPIKTYDSAKRHALSHYERKHQRRALFQFKRAARACPQRASEIGQFYYDNHDYKHAVYFYEKCIKAGDAPPQTYRRAAKAYEKCARAQPWDDKDCMTKARMYRALSPQKGVAAPIPAPEPPKDEVVVVVTPFPAPEPPEDEVVVVVTPLPAPEPPEDEVVVVATPIPGPP